MIFNVVRNIFPSPASIGRQVQRYYYPILINLFTMNLSSKIVQLKCFNLNYKRVQKLNFRQKNYNGIVFG